MLSGLRFETAPARAAGGYRADVACFIGHVARRPRTPLTATVRERLARDGWQGGVWLSAAESAARVEGLLNLPVSVDSWEEFDRLFAWEDRRVADGQEARCASYLGASVRAFFAHGGRRAVIVRVGDPWSYVGGASRVAQRGARQLELMPARPFSAVEPGTWRGIEHLYGLDEVSHLCLPDLADLFAGDPDTPAVEVQVPGAKEVFAECSEGELPAPADSSLRRLRAPRLDESGFAAWNAALDRVRGFLAQYRRDVLLLASLPLPSVDAAYTGGVMLHAQADWSGFLQHSGVLAADDGAERRPRNALCQFAWPWVRTQRSVDLPELLEPAEGLLAGRLAINALTRGTFRSIAGTRLPDVVDCVPMPYMGIGADSPMARLAQRVCVIGPEPDGMTLLSDVTASSGAAWRSGAASRVVAAVLRAARQRGVLAVFEPNGPELWQRVRADMEALLESFRVAGGLGGSTAEEAYEVRCDRSTMSQNDLDNGRIRVQVALLPVAAVERITISLELRAAGAGAGVMGEVA